MQITCLNGWGGRLYEELVSYLAASQPDVLCLQEVVHTPDSTEPWLVYCDLGMELPQRANLFAEIRDILPNHVAVFCPCAQGELWRGNERIASQWGIATYVHRSLPIIAQIQAFVHGAFSPCGYGDHPRSRNAHAIRVFDFELGFPVTIAHMHGLRDPAGKHDNPARLAQAERLKTLVRSIAESGDRIVVCGDFNVTPDSQTFEALGAIGLTDLVTTRGFSNTRTSYYRKEGRYADYMLINDLLASATFEVVERPEVSDHCPLVLRMTR
jgi:endonuclease/exonuclease/phosphatase family metal-dependent hydrolase